MLGALIGAGSSLLGGILGNKSASKAADKNAALQKEFAQSGIQWKVEDAKKAGVHPLAALGANTVSFTPSYVGGDYSSLERAGQNIGQAIDRTATASQKLDVFTEKMQSLQLQKAELENQALASNIAVTNQQLRPPMAAAIDPYVMEGQTQSGVKNVPMERIMSAHGHPGLEAGPVSDVGFARTYTGGLAPMYSSDAKQRLEDDWLGMLAWNVRNRLVPSLSLGYAGPRPPGHSGFYDPILQEWVPWKKGGK